MRVLDPTILIVLVSGGMLGLVGGWLLMRTACRRRLDAINDRRRFEVEQRNAQIDALRGVLNSRKADLRDAREETQRVQANLEAAQRTLHHNGARITRLHRDIDAAARDVADRSSTLSGLQGHAERSAKVIAGLARDVRERDDRIQSLHRELAKRPAAYVRSVG